MAGSAGKPPPVVKKREFYLTNSAIRTYGLILTGRDGGIWQTRKIQDLVGITPVRVQVPLAAMKRRYRSSLFF